MNNENQWLFIEPYVVITINDKKALFYNSLNGEKLEYSNSSKIYNLAKRLNSNKNSYIVKLSKIDMDDFEIYKFAKNIRNLFIGDLVNTSFSQLKPFQFKPILNIQKGVYFLKKSKDFNVGRHMMQYLNELTLQLNEKCSLDCINCDSYYKQFSFCTKSNKISNELDINQIERIIEDIKGTSMQKIKIIGGDIFKYSELEELNKFLNKYPYLIEYYIQYKNLYLNLDMINVFNESNSLNILVNGDIDFGILTAITELLQKKGLNVSFSFVTSNNNECGKIEEIISNIGIENYTIRPFYNKSNLSFFKENVFINKKDIFEEKPTLNDIFIRQTINQINFGKLLIKSNGDVYSNPNDIKLGNIKIDTIYDSVFNEMDSGRSWWSIRTKVKPCNKCVYNLICPPISNYEIYTKRYNLCHIHR